MRRVKLLSNGSYRVMVSADGSGYRRWKSMAVTRWREDAALDDTGPFMFIRDADARVAWATVAPPRGDRGALTLARFDAAVATFARSEHAIEATTTVAVAPAMDVELRRVRVTNLSQRRRHLAMTSYSEIVLAPAATDSAHPAFSKLFVETAVDASLGAIFASRRPSAPQEPRPFCFHAAATRSEGAPMSYETDRMRFVGRGRTAAEAEALGDDAPLSGHAGPVLDAIASIRVPLVLEAGASCTVDWFTGIAATRAECEELVRQCREPGEAERVIDSAGACRDDTLRRIGASRADALVYESLAGAVLYASTDLRAPAPAIAANERGQSSLWGFGISGDVPVVLVQVQGADGFELVRQMVRAHAFWNACGIASELMIVGAAAPTERERLRAQVQDAIGAAGGADLVGKPDGIFVADDATLDDGDRTLLRSVARIVATGTWQGLLDRLEPRPPSPAPALPPPRRSHATHEPSVVVAPGEFVAANGHGRFSADLREYVVTVSASHMTPAPWVNVIANPQFGTLISESGSASTWSENAHELRLTPWSNDPVGDPNGEAFYIRDEASGSFWSPTLLPGRGAGPWHARHGFGYSVFEHLEDGIESTLRVHVAIDAPVKFSTLTLCNRSERARRLSVTGYVEWVLGDERAKTLMHVVTELEPESGAVLARNGYQADFAGRTAFFDVDVAADAAAGGGADAERDAQGDARSACGDRGDFFGPGGTRAAPAALAAAQLSGRFGAALDPCAALRVVVELAPGEAREVTFRLGAGKTAEEARELVRRWRGAAPARESFAAVREHWRRSLGAVEVRTPDATVNAMANGWLLYQVLASRLWGRTAFYQSSGAFGFRDQLQDVMALVHGEPALVREHLLRAAARQFVEGDVQHWWHPPSGKGVRTRCSDDFLWLPLATSRYVEVTGDAGVLDVVCPFLESRPLHDGEQSSYELPKVAGEQACLYEHCVRAIRHGFRYGAHRLPLMGAGDWNDGMNLVGAGGKGESVWLAFFLIAVLQRFAPLARARADNAFAEQCESEAQALRERVESSSWDGAWYRRAYFDDGSPLGSAANAECRIDSIAQSWAVLSGAAPAGRARTAMESVDRELVHRDTRLVQLLSPPFDTSKPPPGYIQGYVPGVRENGGQYTHAAIWVALAFATLGDGDRAWELFGLLAPIRHGANSTDVATYKVEPYVVAGDVYQSTQHAGRGGWTWYTGSAGWMYRLLVESLLGLERRGERLRVRPLLPTDWPGFEMRYRFGRTRYEIACRAAAQGEGARVSVDGAESADGWIALVDDGRVRSVAVTVCRNAPPAPT
jgi:cyclic beta-1,2-glucan synthetase